MSIKVHIIAPYESMLFIIKECIPLFPELNITYSVGDLEKGAEKAALEEKNGADIIISRGGTATLIKQAVAIPVVDMQLSGYDMIRSLTLAAHFQEKTAIVGFPSITSGAQSIIELLDLPLHVYTIKSSEEVAPLLLELKNSNYKQIAGDVITFETANAYGLKGFLIQSGKETIIKSLEDAKIIYGYLHNRNITTHIFEQFTLESSRNILIYDHKNSSIYEHLIDFHTNPLTEEQLLVLHAELDLNRNNFSKNFVLDDCIIDVNGHEQLIDNNRYKLYVLKKSTFSLKEQQGITVHSSSINEPIAAASTSIRHLLQQMTSLYERYEPILLSGEKGTGKNFITSYIHQQFNQQGLLLTIDFKDFKLEHLDKIALDSVSTIKIKHLHTVQDYETSKKFIKACLEHKVHLFILEDDAYSSSIFQQISINKLQMPTLAERTEDIELLVQYFLADYHQAYGTTAVKISVDALTLLQQHTYNFNIDALKSIIKQIAFIEKDYVIHGDTIQNVLANSKIPLDIISMDGTLREIEKKIIKYVLVEENNNQSRTAERLGINRATLWRKLKD